MLPLWLQGTNRLKYHTVSSNHITLLGENSQSAPSVGLRLFWCWTLAEWEADFSGLSLRPSARLTDWWVYGCLSGQQTLWPSAWLTDSWKSHWPAQSKTLRAKHLDLLLPDQSDRQTDWQTGKGTPGMPLGPLVYPNLNLALMIALWQHKYLPHKKIETDSGDSAWCHITAADYQPSHPLL